jgi:hypothetical protein
VKNLIPPLINSIVKAASLVETGFARSLFVQSILQEMSGRTPEDDMPILCSKLGNRITIATDSDGTQHVYMPPNAAPGEAGTYTYFEMWSTKDYTQRRIVAVPNDYPLTFVTTGEVLVFPPTVTWGNLQAQIAGGTIPTPISATDIAVLLNNPAPLQTPLYTSTNP